MDLLTKIYKQIICNEDNNKEAEKIIEQISERYKKQMNEEEVESLQEEMYLLVIKAEEHGFQLGTKFLRRLISEVFLEA